MALFQLNPVGFIPTTDPAAARMFFEKTLGLEFASDDGFAAVYMLGPTGDLMLRVVKVHPDHHKPTPMTIYGWESHDIEKTVDELVARGVVFERYPNFAQDDKAIWTAPNGARVAWFKDPSGNTLSVSQHT